MRVRPFETYYLEKAFKENQLCRCASKTTPSLETRTVPPLSDGTVPLTGSACRDLIQAPASLLCSGTPVTAAGYWRLQTQYAKLVVAIAARRWCWRRNSTPTT